MQAIMLLLAIGLPLALIFAWAFELTPEGLKTTKDVDRSESVTHNTGRNLDRIIIGVLVDLGDLQRLQPLEDFQPQKGFDQRVHGHSGTNPESDMWRACGNATQFALPGTHALTPKLV
jgi:hypothetical protein